MKLKVILRPEEDGGYSVEVPALPGCFSQGDTLEDALANIKEAAEGWLHAAASPAVAEAGSARVAEIATCSADLVQRMPRSRSITQQPRTCGPAVRQ